MFKYIITVKFSKIKLYYMYNAYFTKVDTYQLFLK